MSQRDVRYIPVDKTGFYKVIATKGNIRSLEQQQPAGGYVLAMIEFLTRSGKFKTVFSIASHITREWKPSNDAIPEKECAFTFAVLSDFITIESVMREMVSAGLVSDFDINSQEHYNSLPIR